MNRLPVKDDSTNESRANAPLFRESAQPSRGYGERQSA
jgi:hypothetical protein